MYNTTVCATLQYGTVHTVPGIQYSLFVAIAEEVQPAKKIERRSTTTNTQTTRDFLAMAKTSGGHAHRHHHGSRKPPLCADIDSPDKVHFKRLKPRVGSQFQTRVPRLGSARSSRPAPEHMSTEDLHAIELEKDEVMDIGEDVVCFFMHCSSARDRTSPIHPQLIFVPKMTNGDKRDAESTKKQQHCFI
jgi:hypothetical protein